MGVDVDAEIMYGMVLCNEDETFVKVPWRKTWEDDDYDRDDESEPDFEKWVLEQLGLPDLDWSTYPNISQDYQGGETYDAYRARQKVATDAWDKLVGYEAWSAKKKELLATVPVEEDSGGSDSYRTHILRLKGLPKIRANWTPEAFNPEDLILGPIDALHNRDARDFLLEYNVIWEPKWLLVPSYG